MSVNFLHTETLKEQFTEYEASQATARRRLLQTDGVTYTDGDGEIANPLVCLETDEMIIFQIWLDDTDRSLSNYPKYMKDHLFNSNPDFDYGDFTELEYYILETNVTYNAFAYQFTEAGTYVFVDAQDFNRYG